MGVRKGGKCGGCKGDAYAEEYLDEEDAVVAARDKNSGGVAYNSSELYSDWEDVDVTRLPDEEAGRSESEKEILCLEGFRSGVLELVVRKVEIEGWRVE